jgi:hypothetical protein
MHTWIGECPARLDPWPLVRPQPDSNSAKETMGTVIVCNRADGAPRHVDCVCRWSISDQGTRIFARRYRSVASKSVGAATLEFSLDRQVMQYAYWGQSQRGYAADKENH